MLEVRNLEIEVNNRIIISNLNFTLNKEDKLAIIGEEGNGKSTLLKIITGFNIDYATVSGTINRKGNSIGYLEQFISNLDLLVIDYLFKDENYYTSKLYKLLKELDLNEEILYKELKTLSGGEKVKIQLLKILLEDPDILLLDEPTNDLDIETLNWLESFINNCSKPIIYVSHDETLLENTANMILHLELIKNKTEPKNTVSKSNYKDYIDTRIRGLNKQEIVARKELQNYKKQEAKLNQIMNKVEHELRTISRGDPHGAQLLKKKMKSLKSQEKRLNNKDLTEIPDYEESINFFFDDTTIHSKKEIIKLHIPELKINDKLLSKNINLDVRGNDHIVITGKNGVGKTTLIKIIYDKLKDRNDIVLGYMPQDYNDILKDYNTPIDFLCNKEEEIPLIRSYMGNMNFTRDEMTNNIDNLSGGSKAKLILLKFMINKCNVLLLDEPTRNVSPLSNPVIRKSLKEFKGTIISVSHDRKYINEVCNIIYELNDNGLIEKNKE